MACRSIQTNLRPSSSEPVHGKEPQVRSTLLQSALIPLLCPRASIVLASWLTVRSHLTFTLTNCANQYATTPGDCVTSEYASPLMTPNKSQLLWCRSDSSIATHFCAKCRNQTSLNCNASKTVWLVSSPELENVITLLRSTLVDDQCPHRRCGNRLSTVEFLPKNYYWKLLQGW